MDRRDRPTQSRLCQPGHEGNQTWKFKNDPRSWSAVRRKTEYVQHGMFLRVPPAHDSSIIVATCSNDKHSRAFAALHLQYSSTAHDEEAIPRLSEMIKTIESPVHDDDDDDDEILLPG
jgi:hypothetical protein